jgi:hypothetical protein
VVLEAIRGGEHEPARDQGRERDRDRCQGDDCNRAHRKEQPEHDPEQPDPDRMGEDEEGSEPQPSHDRLAGADRIGEDRPDGPGQEPGGEQAPPGERRQPPSER